MKNHPVAFISYSRAVIDYKFRPDNPLPPNQTGSQLTNDYSKTFIDEAAKELGDGFSASTFCPGYAANAANIR